MGKRPYLVSKSGIAQRGVEQESLDEKEASVRRSLQGTLSSAHREERTLEGRRPKGRST